MSELNLTYHGSAYEYVSEIRLIRDLFNTLQIDVDTVMQYFMRRGMTSNIQTQLVHICNKNIPNLNNIFDKIFCAIDKYNEVSRRNNSRRGAKEIKQSRATHAFAANISHDGVSGRRVMFCSLCSERNGRRETSHATCDCPVYKTSGSKHNRLKSVDACTLCSYSNHSTNAFNFKFNKFCMLCNGPHMTFLCVATGANI